MQAKAITKYVKISPRKARLAAGLIRGKGVEDALTQLMFSDLRAGKLLTKTLNSAVANAESLFSVQKRDLIISEVRVDVGPVMKRSKSKARGGRVPVMKRTSHFTIVVESK